MFGRAEVIHRNVDLAQPYEESLVVDRGLCTWGSTAKYVISNFSTEYKARFKHFKVSKKNDKYSSQTLDLHHLRHSD
jgi:hypothetical protein